MKNCGKDTRFSRQEGIITPTFALSQDTIDRLHAKFSEFQYNREILSELIDDYTADYRQASGTTLVRQETLREKYSKRAPNFSHLIWNDDDNTELWTAADIAIVLGRDKSSVTRTLAVMESSEGWCSRLLALRHTDKAANGLTIYSYSREIFDLIIDHYEEEYLQRFANPRHGPPKDIDEVRRFWKYLKQSAEANRMNILSHEEHELPDIPPMRWNDILSLIWRKIFTVRTGAFFGITFALSFEFAGRWTGIKPFFVSGGFCVTALCMLMIRLRKWRIDVLADIGAGALLFGLLWTAGMSSSYNYRPQAMKNRDILVKSSVEWVEVYRINDEVFVTVNPVLYSELAGDVEALEYGINREPDILILKANLKDYYDQITSVKDDSIRFVTSRLLFTDGSKSDTRRGSLQ